MTEEQRQLCERFFRYAIKVAFRRAMRPYDEHEIQTAAEDALMSAARYFDENRSRISFTDFYVRCLLPRLARAYHERNRGPCITMGIPGTSPDHAFEDRECVDRLRQGLPARQAEVLHRFSTLA